MLRPKIGLDWDDVTAPFNSIAVDMANRRYSITPPLTLDDIDSWEYTGRAEVVREFYRDPELYARQKVPEKTKKAVRRLMEIADVYFITAVFPDFMGVRAKQILTEFPELPHENIILGTAKNLIQFDVILDDAIHNVLESPAAYPVLMRKPWNWKMTGLLSVNNMTEFVHLVRQIIRASQSRTLRVDEPTVLALVGPSGAGKTQISRTLCEDERFDSPKTYCTRPGDKHHYLTEEQFARENFFEKTRYAGVRYGTKKEEIQEVLDRGQNVVMPLDMCGAIAMKRYFPTLILFIDKDKEVLIRSIVEEEMEPEEKTLRILSIDAEKRNRQICDAVIDNRGDDGVRRILALLER